MKIYIAKNDGDWIDRHRQLRHISTTDWWHDPNAKTFRGAEAGDLFFFTLNGTRDISGFAKLTFDYREELPHDAWLYSNETYTKDSTPTSRAVEVLKRGVSSDSRIGLLMFHDLQWFPDGLLPPLPESFAKFTVTGQVYHASDPDFEYLHTLAREAVPTKAAEYVQDTFLRCTDAQIAEIAPLHRAMSFRFANWLRSKGYAGVLQEQDGVDTRFREGKDALMAELKICYGLNTRQAIREALGQIIEYNHFEGRVSHDSWWIVLDKEPTRADRKYIEMIRSRYGLPLFLGWENTPNEGRFVVDR
jgi:hypothetical protein